MDAGEVGRRGAGIESARIGIRARGGACFSDATAEQNAYSQRYSQSGSQSITQVHKSIRPFFYKIMYIRRDRSRSLTEAGETGA